MVRVGVYAVLTACCVDLLAGASPLRASTALQRVAITLTSCNREPIGETTLYVQASPGWFRVSVIKRTVPASEGTIVALLAPGNYEVVADSAECTMVLAVSVLEGFDRSISTAMRENHHMGTDFHIWGSVAGRLPNGIASAELQSVAWPGARFVATIDHGAYYAQLSGRGLYVLRLTSGRTARETQYTVALPNLHYGELGRRDVSDADYRSASSATGSPFYRPGKVVTNNGGAWFLDTAGNRVERVDRAGTLHEYDFSTPFASAYDIAATDDFVWVTESSAAKIARIDLAGRMTEFTTPGRPLAISLGGDRRIWFTENTSSSIGAISANGAISQYAIPSGYYFGELVLGPDGRVWLTGGPFYDPKSLIAVSPSGSSVFYNMPRPFDTDVIVGMAAGSSSIWLSVDSDGILQMSPQGKMLRDFAVPLRGSGALRMLEDAAGTLWFSDAQRGETLGMVPPGGAIYQSYVKEYPAAVTDLTTDRKGNVWYVESGVSAIRSGGRTLILARPWGADVTYAAFDANNDPWFSAPKSELIGGGPAGKLICYNVRTRARIACGWLGDYQ